MAGAVRGLPGSAPDLWCVRKEPAMADVAVIGIFMVSMGFVMWIGHLVTGMVSGAGDGAEHIQ